MGNERLGPSSQALWDRRIGLRGHPRAGRGLSDRSELGARPAGQGFGPSGSEEGQRGGQSRWFFSGQLCGTGQEGQAGRREYQHDQGGQRRGKGFQPVFSPLPGAGSIPGFLRRGFFRPVFRGNARRGITSSGPWDRASSSTAKGISSPTTM